MSGSIAQTIVQNQNRPGFGIARFGAAPSAVEGDWSAATTTAQPQSPQSRAKNRGHYKPGGSGTSAFFPNDCRPFTDAPCRDEAVGHVRIGVRERFGNRRRCALEQQHGSVDRIRERAAEDQVAARDRGLRMRDVILAGTPRASPRSCPRRRGKAQIAYRLLGFGTRDSSWNLHHSARPETASTRPVRYPSGLSMRPGSYQRSGRAFRPVRRSKLDAMRNHQISLCSSRALLHRLRPHVTGASDDVIHRILDPESRIQEVSARARRRCGSRAAYADGFNALPLREKTLIWHLYQAALAGRDIFIDQKHRSALEMRGILDQIVAHPQGDRSGDVRRDPALHELFWINNGPYNNLTARKFVLKTTPEALRRRGEGAQARGRDVRDAERRIARRDARAAPADVLRSQRRPERHDKAPPAGQGHPHREREQPYAGGVTMNDVKGFTEKYGLNARLVKANGKLTEEVYKIDGRYSKQISRDRPAPAGRDSLRHRADGRTRCGR